MTATCGSTILSGRPLRTHAKGRTCEHPGCVTKLNQYNGSRYCYQHDNRERFDVEALIFAVKHCPACERDLPASSDFWHKDSGAEDGLSRTCSKCRSVAEKESA